MTTVGAESLRDTELSYVSPEEPGILRRRVGRGFSYVGPGGRRVEDTSTLDRIRSLVIPPAWTGVWICADPNGHLQAIGRDQKGRRQYIYHPSFRALRDRTKYEHLADFAEALPAIRARVEADMALRGLPRDKVLATVVALMERTLIRVGNDSYAKDNDSYGLTTMRDPHVAVEGETIRFLFKGKSGKEWNLTLRDRRLAKTVRACQDIPGQRLFQYYAEDGSRHSVTSSDLNAYLRDITGRDITAKDFRTWAGTVGAVRTFAEVAAAAPDRPRAKTLRETIVLVARRLGNTPTVCRQCYIHPAVLQAFESGEPLPLHPRRKEPAGLSREEAEVLWFIRDHVERTALAA
ncbi:MAG: DNA topoisomerase IB [Bauldia sp.]